jgi:3-hydroxybutyryl-CoA dehydrogenase
MAGLSGDELASRLRRVVVLGGGTMGAGIAHVLADAGVSVTVVEASGDAAAAAEQRLAASVRGSAARGKLHSSEEAVLSRVDVVAAQPSFADVELVVEALPERLELKRSVLAATEDALEAGAVVATNTSSLSIAAIAQALRRPERLVGMHFFNPVPASVLVEVVRGPASANTAVELAHGLATRLGKETIEVADAPGFATSRLGVLLGLEAIRMVEEGVASPADVDRAMVLGYRHPMGPLRLGDLVGLDVRLGIAEYLATTLGPRFDPPALLRRLVAEGHLGQKSGQGFYTWA